jgi:hypothetical protein
MINITNNHPVKNKFHDMEAKSVRLRRLLLQCIKQCAGMDAGAMHAVDLVMLAWPNGDSGLAIGCPPYGNLFRSESSTCARRTDCMRS